MDSSPGAELTQVVPPELLDAVLEETGAREQRLRSLPCPVGVNFVLARSGCSSIWAPGWCGASCAFTTPCTIRRRNPIDPRQPLRVPRSVGKKRSHRQWITPPPGNVKV
ncbi:transposase domain-containing protein [Streptomyces sp. NPDC059349]|uniref:transposase domain-containing protein n=1 Tax=Streptomyces sp. NPDC059349 TaxID=3346808 RepID=UPI0036BB157D